jgi:hypothetical protein
LIACKPEREPTPDKYSFWPTALQKPRRPDLAGLSGHRQVAFPFENADACTACPAA